LDGKLVSEKIKSPQIAAFFTHRFSAGDGFGQANYRPAETWVERQFSGVATAPRGQSSRRSLTDNARIAADSTARGWKRLGGRAIDWLEPDHNPTGVVYGTMIIGAVLASESVRRETLVETVGATLLALLLYWLAHSYAATLGERLDRQVPLSASGIWRALLRDRAIVRGAIIPILALLIASALGASLATAVLVAVWTSSATIIAFEVVAGIRAELRGRELAVQICAGAVMGLAIIGLRTVLH
jgi:hypothetical protein